MQNPQKVATVAEEEDAVEEECVSSVSRAAAVEAGAAVRTTSNRAKPATSSPTAGSVAEDDADKQLTENAGTTSGAALDIPFTPVALVFK